MMVELWEMAIKVWVHFLHFPPNTGCAIMIWKKEPSIEKLQEFSIGTMVQHLGIVFTEVGDNYLEARMPVDFRTLQPFGLLHGGASAVLAETLGSIGAYYCIDHNKVCVGLEINANHIRSARNGWVTGRAMPLHLGRTTHVWEIRINDDEGNLTCISRLTMMILVKQGDDDEHS
jgi:1,4-dihydroxy-2-naphthoyl-CoA hydrolase